MSKFLGLSKEECEVLIIEEPERPLTCPSCVPDLSAPNIDWLTQTKPYFDPKTCEYIINFLAPDKVQNLKEPLKEYIKTAKILGAVQLTKHFNKQNIVAPDSSSEDPNMKKIKASMVNTFVDRSNLIRIRVAINAVDMDKLADRIIDPNEEDPDNSNSDLPTELIINDSNFEFSNKLFTTMVGLRGYEYKQNISAATSRTLIRRDSEEEFVIFKYSKFIDNINSFKDKLEEFLKDNGFKILSIFNVVSFEKAVKKIRIELDNSNEDFPLKINKVFVESEGCPEVELLIGIDDFKQKAYMPDAIFFLSNFASAYGDIIAEPTKDWIEFSTDYIYPPVLIDTEGDSALASGQSSGPGGNYNIGGEPSECNILDLSLSTMFENFLNDLAVGVGDLFAIGMDANSCSQDPKKSNPTVKQFMNPIKQREFENLYRKDLEKRKKRFSKTLRLLDEAAEEKRENETDLEYQERKKEAIEKKQKLLEFIDRSSQEEANRLLNDDLQNNPDKYNPLTNMWRESLDAKFNSDNSIFEIWEAISESDGISELAKFQTYIDTIGLCGLNKGMQNGLNCLFKQVTFEDAFKSIIKVSFGKLPPDFWESVLLAGLTPLQQTEIRNKVANKLGTNLENVKWPWEMGQNNKEIQKQNAQRDAIKKQYIADLEEDIKNGDEEAIKLLKEEKDRQIRILKNSKTIISDSDEAKFTFDIDTLDEKQIEEIAEENAYEALAEKQAKKQGTGRRETDISSDLNEVLGDIVEAYVDVIFELFGIDDLLVLFESVPMVQLLYAFAQSFVKCPTKVLKDLEQNKIKEFKLDICNPSAPVINKKIPKIDFNMSPLKVISTNFKKIIRETITKVLSKLIKMILDFLEDNLCKLAELFGKLALRPDQFFGDLGGTFRKAFCPDASEEDAKNLANNLLNNIGLKDDDISSAIDCLGGALAGSFTEDELVSLMIDENPSPALLDRVADVVRVSCPRFADVFGDRDGAKNIFNRIRDLLPEEAKQRLRDLTSIPSNMPLYDTICLTSEELELWDNLRRGNLEAAGLSPEEAAEQVENYNRRARNSLEEILDGLGVDGPNELLEDALQDLFAPNDGKPPGCDLKEGESNFGSKAIKETEDIVRVQDDISDRIMNIIGDAFDREYSENPNPFSPSLIHRIMRDTQGNDYGYHGFLENLFFTRLDYHNSEGSEEKKETAPWWTKFLGGILDGTTSIGDDGGYYPETIGKELEVQGSLDYEYATLETNIVAPEIFQPDYKVSFNAEYLSDDEYGYVGYYSDIATDDLNKIMNYSLKSKTLNKDPKIYEESVNIENGIKQIIDNFALNSDNKKREAFSKMIQQKLSPLSLKPTIDYNILFDKTCETVFNSIKKIIFKDSPGLLFGFEEEDLTEEELTYVGPNGEEPYKDFYSEEDKVLGRAKQETDRVFFLNPDQYGGSYMVPPVYIRPKANKGWMKISEVVTPSKTACAPEAESIIKFSEIKKHVNDVRNSLNFDPRIKASIDQCFVEKPFDKILSKSAASSLDGISRIHIRMAIIKILTKSFPALTNLKYTEENYGTVLTDIIYEELYSNLTSIDPIWPTDKKTNIYAMLVLEQIVQSYEREEIKGLPSGSIGGKDLSSLEPSVQDAYENIVYIRDNYTYNNIFVRDGALKRIFPANDDISFLQNENFALYGMAYKKYGESLFSEDFRFDWNGCSYLPFTNPPIPILPFVDYKLFSKSFAIRLGLESVKVITKKIIQKELEKILNYFHENFEPKIENLLENLLTSDSLFYDNNLKSFGTTDYYKRKKMGSLTDFGDVHEAQIEVQNRTPWDDLPEEESLFKIEKYVRFIKKEEGGNEVLDIERAYDGTVREYLGNKGVQSLEKAQEFIDLQKEEYGELYISELFGDAELSEDANSYTGHMGISYGIRIIFRAPQSSFVIADGELSDEDRNLSNLEKAYFCKNSQSQISLTNANNFSIPIISREIELKDKQIKEINFLSGEDSYDLECLLKKLSESDEYKLLFKYLCPAKASASMSLLYSNEFFIQSIGMNDGWSGPPGGESGSNIEKKKDILGNWDHEVGANFTDTELISRKYFASFYDSTKFINNENFRLPKIELPDLFGMLFGQFKLPQINLSVELPDFEWLGHKIIKENPLDKNYEVCEEPVDKFFD